MSRNILQGLVGAWCPSLGPSGYTLLDRSGGGQHLTLTNMDAGSDWVSTPGGWALDFDGTNDYATLSTASRLPTGNSEITVSSWVKFTTSARFEIVHFSGANANLESYFLYKNSSGKIVSEMSNSFNAVTGATTVTANVWYHVVARYNKTTNAVYINGVQDASASTSNAANFSTSRQMYIGTFSSLTLWLLGQIKEHAVWNRALTDTEIRHLYLIGSTGMPSVSRLLTQRPQRRVFRTAQGNRRRRLICGAEC